jgi:hypothetical protein
VLFKKTVRQRVSGALANEEGGEEGNVDEGEDDNDDEYIPS